MTNNNKPGESISLEKENKNEKRKVVSLDVAEVMLKYKSYMRISDIAGILKITNPSLIIEKSKISFIVRNFVSSVYCTCAVDKSTYPHRYFLMSTGTYTFKPRKKNRIDVNKFPLYLKSGTPRIAKKEKEKQEEIRRNKKGYCFIHFKKTSRTQ